MKTEPLAIVAQGKHFLVQRILGVINEYLSKGEGATQKDVAGKVKVDPATIRNYAKTNREIYRGLQLLTFQLGKRRKGEAQEVELH